MMKFKSKCNATEAAALFVAGLSMAGTATADSIVAKVVNSS